MRLLIKCNALATSNTRLLTYFLAFWCLLNKRLIQIKKKRSSCHRHLKAEWPNNPQRLPTTLLIGDYCQCSEMYQSYRILCHLVFLSMIITSQLLIYVLVVTNYRPKIFQVPIMGYINLVVYIQREIDNIL